MLQRKGAFKFMKMNKNTCMRFLNEQEIKGPFSCAEEVKRSMDSCEET